jgi:Phage capsid family
VNVPEGMTVAMRKAANAGTPVGANPQSAEGATKQFIDDFVIVEGDKDMNTYAAYVRASKQILDDAPSVRAAIDAMLLSRLTRVIHYAVTDNAAGVYAGTATSANGKIIEAARQAYTFSGMMPDTLVMHPTTYYTLCGLGDDIEDGDLEMLWAGMTPCIADSLNADEFIVGPYQQASALFIREDVNITVGMIGTDFIDNVRTVLAEARGNFDCVDADAFIKGSIA